MTDNVLLRDTRAASFPGVRRSLRIGASVLGIAASVVVTSQTATAQVVPPPNLVGACTGASLPRSYITDLLAPVIGGVVAPIQNTVNPILGVVGAVLPLVRPLDIQVTQLLADAAVGNPITLQVLNRNGTIVGPTDRCDSQADGFSLRTPQGIAIGGNRITGLGSTGLEAVAGEANSVAFGNSARTAASAVGSIAFGARSSVGANATGAIALGSDTSATGINSVALGANSVAARAPLGTYTAIGLTGPQASVGEVSVGAVGAERQITNVAAGSALTDAVNVGQLAGVQAQIGAVATGAVLYDGATRDRVTLAGATGTVIGNVAAGSLAAGSTEAVNGSQLGATNTTVTNLTTNINNGAVGALRYSNAATPRVPNGGVPSNDATLVGVAAGPVGLHNVANGVVATASTDAVNGGQLAELAAISVQFDDQTRTRVTLGGTGAGVAPVALGNVAAGNLAAGSTDAVNGGQLFATNTAVTNTNTAVTNLTTNINNGAVGAVRYSNAATPTVPNGGVPSNDVTLVGGAAGAVGLHNVANGVVAAGSTDAVNGGQLAGVSGAIDTLATLAVRYDDPTRTRVTLGGSAGAAPVGVGNVAAGALAAGSTDAVNGSQLFATNSAVTNLTTNINNGAVGALRYSNAATPTVPNGGVPSNHVTLVGGASGAVGLHNVANGVVATGSTDAVNGGQLAGVTGAVDQLAALAVQYDDASRARVTLGGTGAAPVTLGNVAAGTLAVGSTEAVNGGQVVAFGNSVAASLGGLSTYDAMTNSVLASIGFGGVQYANVQSAFDAVQGTIAGTAASRYFQVLSTRAAAVVTGTDSVAIGPEARASAANSIALGTGSTATRGATAGYAALGVTGLQNSAGEVSVGTAGATRQITNVAAGTAATDAANVGQVAGVAAQVAALGSSAVQYDDATRTRVTLGGVGTGAAAATITNVAAGTLAAGSSDAVNGAQLFATNTQVATNTTAITNLGNQVANGGTGPVQYSNPGSPTTPNGGVRTNDLTLVGAAAGPVGLHNVAGGSIAAGSTDAVNGGQVYALALTTANAVSYDTDANGVRTNSVTLVGGNAAAPVSIGNVAAGTLSAGSTQAVNGGQLNTTNQAVTAAQGTANTALTLGSNSVQYGPGRTTVTFNAGGAASVLSNVAAGVSATDAANVGQLNTGINSAITQSNAYTDTRIVALGFDLRNVRRDGSAGTSGALAAAGLPQAYEAGKGMIALGGGTYAGQSAVALGFSKAFNDAHTVVKLSGTYDSQGRGGASGGIGYQF